MELYLEVAIGLYLVSLLNLIVDTFIFINNRRWKKKYGIERKNKKDEYSKDIYKN